MCISVCPCIIRFIGKPQPLIDTLNEIEPIRESA